MTLAANFSQFFFLSFFIVSEWITRTTQIICFLNTVRSDWKTCSRCRRRRRRRQQRYTTHLHTYLYGLLFFCVYTLHETNLVQFCSFVRLANLLAFAEITISSSLCYGWSEKNRNMENNKLLCNSKCARPEILIKIRFFLVRSSDETLASIWIFGYF